MTTKNYHFNGNARAEQSARNPAKGGAGHGKTPQKGMDYFPHFTNSSMDLKISAMEMQFGFAGYAFYFKLLEILYADENTNLKHPGVIPACAKKIGITVKKFNAMLEYALSVGLFEKSAYEKPGKLHRKPLNRSLQACIIAGFPTQKPLQKPRNMCQR